MMITLSFFFFNDTATTEIYTLSLHDALPIWILFRVRGRDPPRSFDNFGVCQQIQGLPDVQHQDIVVRSQQIVERLRNYRRRSEEHTSELQSHLNLVCRLLLEKKKIR